MRPKLTKKRTQREGGKAAPYEKRGKGLYLKNRDFVLNNNYSKRLQRKHEVLRLGKAIA